MYKSKRLILAGCVALFLAPQLATADWAFELEPYLLASSIEGDTSMGRVTGLEVDVDMSDILEVLDIGAMVHFEAHNSNGWGVALDYGFMDLGADISGPRGGVVDAGLRQGVLEALLVRRIASGDGHIDYLAGVRWWDNDIDVEIDPAVLPGSVAAEIDEDWIDLVIGIRWVNPLNEKWDFTVRADIGGFGLEADFTSSVAAGVHWKMSESMVLDLQYKATWVDYESGSSGQSDSFSYDTVTHGPVVGLIFNF
jgi:opacity protein-like surface antigen